MTSFSRLVNLVPRVRVRTLLRCLSWFPKAVVNVPGLLYDIKGKEFFGVPIPDVFAIVYTPPLNLINSKHPNPWFTTPI